MNLIASKLNPPRKITLTPRSDPFEMDSNCKYEIMAIVETNSNECDAYSHKLSFLLDRDGMVSNDEHFAVYTVKPL